MSGVDGCREQTGERGVVEEGRFSEPGARRPQGARQSQAGAWEEGARDREQRCGSQEVPGGRRQGPATRGRRGRLRDCGFPSSDEASVGVGP